MQAQTLERLLCCIDGYGKSGMNTPLMCSAMMAYTGCDILRTEMSEERGQKPENIVGRGDRLGPDTLSDLVTPARI